MNRRKFWHILALAAILMGIIPLTVTAARPDWSKVDPLILEKLSLEGAAQFHVVMAVQADVSGAALLSTKVEKGTYVFELLTRTARETQAPILTYLTQQGVTYKSHYIYNVIEVEGNLVTAAWLAGRADVARIVPPPDPRPEPAYEDPPAVEGTDAVEWNITRVGAPDVWAMGFHGEGTVVGDNDTGMQYQHPALVNQYRGNLGGGNFDHNYNWWDDWGTSPSPVPVDYDSHGTHTAGTMVGDDGGSNQIGVAPGAKIIACAGLSLTCLEFFLAPWNLNHQDPRPDLAPDSVNNSWYDPSGYDYRTIVQNMNAAGIAVIKSAGNNGPGCSTISNPGYVPEIIATAAFNSSDVIASFSSRGPSNNYGETILKPEVAAPGVSVRSSIPTNNYGYKSGTSMAAPHTTALVALMWNAAPCIRGNVPLTKQIMMETAEAKIDAQCPPFVDHPNDVWGWGILDMPAAVQAAMGYCGDQGALHGYVTDDVTMAPIVSATVTAQEQGGWTRSAETDASGYYTMTAMVGTYTVTAAHPWYTTGITTGVAVVTDTATQVDFELTMQSYIVSGTVTHAYYGTPIADATVTADPGGVNATTDPTGYYELLLTAGTYDLTAAKAAYTTEVVEDVVVPDTSVVDFELNSAVVEVTPATLHATVHSSDTATLTLNIANPGGMDLFFEIAETTATLPLRYVGQEVTVHVPAAAAQPDAASRVPSIGRPAQEFTMRVGWISQETVDVLLVTPDVAGGGDISLLLNTLAAFPDLAVTTWDGSVGTPTVADMLAYDVVFVGNDILWSSSAIDKTALSNNLADYIDAGGKVLASSFVWSYDDWGLGGGRFIAEDYSPYEIATTDYWDPIALGTFDPGHPIMAGITNVTEGYNHQDPALSPNGTWVASWADGENFVAVAPSCVGLNGLYFHQAVFGGQAGELLHNALLYLAGGMAPSDVPWVSESPISGTVPAGTNLDVEVVFTALAPFHVAGDYTATLVVSHDDPVAVDAVRVPITMTVFECTVVDGADFSWLPAEPVAGEPVTFTGTVAAGEPPLTYTWDLGDGNLDEGEVITHVYGTAGTYTVTMTAANACPSEESVSYVLTVAEPPCVPVEIEGVGGGVDGCVVDLFAVVTGTAPFEYLWDFAAFGTYTTAGVTVDFGVSGSYPYTLTVNNNCGEDIFTETLVVTCTPPCDDVQIVTYTYDIAGCAVDFAVEVTGTAPFTYLWAFGDGMTATVATPSHTYAASGTYSVTVEVRNCAEGYATESFAVMVECGYTIYLPIVFK